MKKKNLYIIIVILVVINGFQGIRGAFLRKDYNEQRYGNLSKVASRLQTAKDLIDIHLNTEIENSHVDGIIIGTMDAVQSLYVSTSKDEKRVQRTNYMWSDITTIITNSRYYGRVKSEGKLKENEEMLQEYLKYYKEVSEFIPIAINNIAVDALKLGKDKVVFFQECTGEEVYEDYLHFKKKAEFLKKNNKYLFKEISNENLNGIN